MAVEQLRTMLLIALAFVLLLMYEAWQTDHAPPKQQAPPAQSQPSSPAAARQATGAAAGAAAAREGVPEVPGGTANVPAQHTQSAAGSAEAKRYIHVHTDVLDLLIDPHGGTIVQADLPEYPVATDKPNVPVQLLNDGSTNLFVAQSGLLGSSAAPDHYTKFQVQKRDYRLAPGSDVLDIPLTWTSPQGIRFTKIFRLHRNSYALEVLFRIDNRGGSPWTGRMYGQLQRIPPPTHHSYFGGNIYTYTGGVISTAEKPYKKVSFDDMASEDPKQPVRPLAAGNTGGWVAMIQHYFAAAWIPRQKQKDELYSMKVGSDRYIIGAKSSDDTVAPGKTGELSMRLYVGPKDQQRMQKVAPYLERTVDYGWLWFIAEPLFWLLGKIHSFVGNWGWSIVILTILIKLAFFQLSATSYKSMARMRRLQPRMNAIRERHAGDRQKMNQAMMALYKEEKVNPLGGCLPIAVQIPVFISLYWMLIENIELRQAPFMFWIHDLSAHDPYFVLPILQGIAMFMQQRLNPSPPDPIQAKVMTALPIVFTFFFLFFPAGLVLYWFVNNVLSMTQQWVITQRIVPKSQ